MTAEAIIAAGIINYPYWLLLSEIKRPADWKIPSTCKVKVKKKKREDLDNHRWATTPTIEDKYGRCQGSSNVLPHSPLICQWILTFSEVTLETCSRRRSGGGRKRSWEMWGCKCSKLLTERKEGVASWQESSDINRSEMAVRWAAALARQIRFLRLP